MKQILLLLFLLLGAGAANLSAQSTWSTTNEDQYKSDIRQKLNLDYSMPGDEMSSYICRYVTTGEKHSN